MLILGGFTPSWITSIFIDLMADFENEFDLDSELYHNLAHKTHKYKKNTKYAKSTLSLIFIRTKITPSYTKTSDRIFSVIFVNHLYRLLREFPVHSLINLNYIFSSFFYFFHNSNTSRASYIT